MSVTDFSLYFSPPDVSLWIEPANTSGENTRLLSVGDDPDSRCSVEFEEGCGPSLCWWIQLWSHGRMVYSSSIEANPSIWYQKNIWKWDGADHELIHTSTDKIYIRSEQQDLLMLGENEKRDADRSAMDYMAGFYFVKQLFIHCFLNQYIFVPIFSPFSFT